MIRMTQILISVIAASLAACSTPAPRVSAMPLRQGLTSAQVLSVYGHPISIQRRSNGAEDWFYNFGSRQHTSQPISESAVSENERSYTVGHTTSTTTTMTQLPIHLSLAGRVIAPLPAGSVIVE